MIYSFVLDDSLPNCTFVNSTVTYAALKSSPWRISATATGYTQRLAKNAF